MEEDDRFGFFVELCQISDSQEEELRRLPFAERWLSDSSSDPQSSRQVQPPPSEMDFPAPPHGASEAANTYPLDDFPTPPEEIVVGLEQRFAADNARRESSDADRRGEGAILESDQGARIESVAEVIARLGEESKREAGERSRLCEDIRVSEKNKLQAGGAFVAQYLKKLMEMQKQYEENVLSRSNVTPTGVEEVRPSKMAVENAALKDSPKAGGVPIAYDEVVGKTSASEVVGISGETPLKELKLSEENVILKATNKARGVSTVCSDLVRKMSASTEICKKGSVSGEAPLKKLKLSEENVGLKSLSKAGELPIACSKVFPKTAASAEICENAGAPELKSSEKLKLRDAIVPSGSSSSIDKATVRSPAMDNGQGEIAESHRGEPRYFGFDSNDNGKGKLAFETESCNKNLIDTENQTSEGTLASDSDTVDSKNAWLKSIRKALSALSRRPVEGLENESIISTAERTGICFPQPHWWRCPNGYAPSGR